MSSQHEYGILEDLRQTRLNLDELTCTRPEFIWLIEHKPDLVIIKYKYERDFACFIKSMQLLHWDEFNNWWYAHKDFSDTIYGLIKSHFPEWKCIDKR